MYTRKGLKSLSPDELVDTHAPLVKRIAYHLVGRLPASVQVDDLIQAGMLGLLDAARHYDESQGAAFETYATIRIRGAMIDELRRNDWAPKSVHKRARDLADAIARVEASTGADANDHDVAEEMGVSLEEYYRILHEASSSRILSLEDLGTSHGGGLLNVLPADAPAPEQNVREQQFQAQLADAIGGLPERERLVMALYYDKELNLREIGELLSVSESRVSQILSQSHLRLRSRLQAWSA